MFKQQEIQVTSYRVQVQKKKAPGGGEGGIKRYFQEEFGHCLSSD